MNPAMAVPRGYCDLRVERLNQSLVDAYVEHGYTFVAVNTIVNCSTLGIGSSNRKKRKIAECNEEKEEEKEWIPVPKSTNFNNSKLTVLSRLTVQISNFGQLQKVVSSPNFKLYHILAVEPLNDRIIQELVTSQYVDIITCSLSIKISPKEYRNAVAKKMHFEILYGPMLINYMTRQDTITLAHMLYIKGKSKNVIISSGAVNKFDIRNPHDVMNATILLGLSKNQSKRAITQSCHLVILKSYGRKLGKTAINLIPMKSTC